MANHHSDEFWKAVLMYSYGYKQKEIAEAIGGSVSQPAVSRYIREARDEGLLKWRVHWPNEVDENRRTEIEESVLPREDRERLKSKLDVWTPRDRPRVQRLHVVYTEEGNISRSFWPKCFTLYIRSHRLSAGVYGRMGPNYSEYR